MSFKPSNLRSLLSNKGIITHFVPTAVKVPSAESVKELNIWNLELLEAHSGGYITLERNKRMQKLVYLSSG